MNGKQAAISQYVGGFTSPLSSEYVTRDKDTINRIIGLHGSILPENTQLLQKTLDMEVGRRLESVHLAPR
jgi:hypothetical protein